MIFVARRSFWLPLTAATLAAVGFAEITSSTSELASSKLVGGVKSSTPGTSKVALARKRLATASKSSSIFSRNSVALNESVPVSVDLIPMEKSVVNAAPSRPSICLVIRDRRSEAMLERVALPMSGGRMPTAGSKRNWPFTKEIAELIKTIQEETKNAIGAVERGATMVDRGVTVSAEAERALQTIRESSKQSTAMVRGIARATAAGALWVTLVIIRGLTAPIRGLFRRLMWWRRRKDTPSR